MDPILLEITAPPGRDPATTWIVIALAVLGIVYVTFVRPLRQKKGGDPLQRPSPGIGLARQRSVEREMSNLLVELSEMARQMTAQLDTRTAKLELLLKEADEKILLLKRAGVDGRRNMAAGELDPDQDAETAAAAALEGVIVEARAPLHAAMPEPQLDPRHSQVYDLADEGHSPQEIARELERPSGEIELILALRSGSGR
jgi:hypothetical protein